MPFAIKISMLGLFEPAFIGVPTLYQTLYHVRGIEQK